MSLEKKTNWGKLNLTRKGTIISNLGSVRGINSLDPGRLASSNLKSTRVKYISSDEIPGQGKSWNDFVFYQNLPFDIEGWKFELGEVYQGEDENGLLLKQILYAYLENTDGKKAKERRFEFP